MIKHTILNISYPTKLDSKKRDWLQCVCGWEGIASDTRPYSLHRKESPLLDETLVVEKMYQGTFIKRRIEI